MKPAQQWKEELAQVQPGHVQRVEGRGGHPTLKAGKVFLHSRYHPQEEAERLVDSAELDPDRPVLVVGLGLGYHIAELAKREFDVAVVEPDPAVARFALDAALFPMTTMMGVGDGIVQSEEFAAFSRRRPQVLLHPPTASIHDGFAALIASSVSQKALLGERLSIAVIAPMFGGSLPIAGYLERAFARMGHRTLLVENHLGWPIYEEVTKSVTSKQAVAQLGEILTGFLNEWTYARTIEFMPDICIVMAQAPVDKSFPIRLSKEGIVTGYWFVENWRHMTYWRDIAPLYDYFFHIQPGEFDGKLREVQCRNQAFVQTACDPEIHKPIDLSADDRADFGCDVSFAGAGYYNRLQLFAGLTDYDFKIWGVDWHSRELAPHLCHPDERFTPEKFAKIVAASKVNLNLHSSTTYPGVDPRSDAINPRVFETAACGGFQLCDPCGGLDTYFDLESELPTYSDLPSLREKIDHYLEHPEERKAVATRARERVLRDHTYENRAQQMLEALIANCGGKILRKGIRTQRTTGEMIEKLDTDSDLARYLASLPKDMLFTHENINEQLAAGRAQLTYPEKVFAYLREVRSFAETLFAGMDE